MAGFDSAKAFSDSSISAGFHRLPGVVYSHRLPRSVPPRKRDARRDTPGTSGEVIVAICAKLSPRLTRRWGKQASATKNNEKKE